MTKYLYQFDCYFGRSGSIKGLFVATEEEVKSAIGCEVDFGEALGKHSHVHTEVEADMFEKLSISPEAVAEVSAFLGRTWSGYNPLDYLQVGCDECGDQCAEEDAEAEGIIHREDFDRVLCEICYEEAKEELDG